MGFFEFVTISPRSERCFFRIIDSHAWVWVFPYVHIFEILLISIYLYIDGSFVSMSVCTSTYVVVTFVWMCFTLSCKHLEPFLRDYGCATCTSKSVYRYVGRTHYRGHNKQD